jgi:SH3 domain-containing YSC84-like protein 1
MRVLALAVSLSLASAFTLQAQTAPPTPTDTHERLVRASQIFGEVMAAPDSAIPEDLLQRAHCAVIVPGMLEGAFIVGAQYGKGFAFCRARGGVGWSNPAAVRLEGGSFGLQIGFHENDVVMLVMNPRGMQRLMTSRFTIGVDGAATAGPIGRRATAMTDAMLTAEILTWARSRGVFAGISLTGSTLRPDETDNRDLYGRTMDTRAVFTTRLPTPAAARPLLAQLQRYPHHAAGVAEADRVQPR